MADSPNPFEAERESSRLLFQPGLTTDDKGWLRGHFEMAGLPTPDVDVSWLQMTSDEQPHWAWPFLLVLPVPVLLVLHLIGVI